MLPTGAPARSPRGTGGRLLTVASSRTWRGSQRLLARDPTIDAPIGGSPLEA